MAAFLVELARLDRLRHVRRLLAVDGAILELDPSQADDVAALAMETFARAMVEIIPDLAGLARFVAIDCAPSTVREADS